MNEGEYSLTSSDSLTLNAYQAICCLLVFIPPHYISTQWEEKLTKPLFDLIVVVTFLTYLVTLHHTFFKFVIIKLVIVRPQDSNPRPLQNSFYKIADIQNTNWAKNPFLNLPGYSTYAYWYPYPIMTSCNISQITEYLLSRLRLKVKSRLKLTLRISLTNFHLMFQIYSKYRGVYLNRNVFHSRLVI